MRNQRGFTIVEISIASGVFAVILLVALVSFTSIGKLFYKGVSIAQTQQTTAEIMQDINGNFQAAANVSPKMTGNGYNYYCIGSNRYTYQIWKQVDLDNTADHSSSGNFGLLKDSLPGGTACAAPCSDTSAALCGAGTLRLSSPTELLGQKMRLAQFDITQPQPGTNPSLYNIVMKVVYGDDAALTYSSSGGVPDYTSAACLDQKSTQDFCSISTVNTTVYRGLAF